MPRPMRFGARRGSAGPRFERFRSSGTLRVLHSHEVADLPEHTRELAVLFVLGRAADAAETERAERTAVLLRLADLTPDLRDPKPRHRPLRAPPRARTLPPSPPVGRSRRPRQARRARRQPEP